MDIRSRNKLFIKSINQFSGKLSQFDSDTIQTQKTNIETDFDKNGKQIKFHIFFNETINSEFHNDFNNIEDYLMKLKRLLEIKDDKDKYQTLINKYKKEISEKQLKEAIKTKNELNELYF